MESESNRLLDIFNEYRDEYYTEIEDNTIYILRISEGEDAEVCTSLRIEGRIVFIDLLSRCSIEKGGPIHLEIL